MEAQENLTYLTEIHTRVVEELESGHSGPIVDIEKHQAVIQQAIVDTVFFQKMASIDGSVTVTNELIENVVVRVAQHAEFTPPKKMNPRYGGTVNQKPGNGQRRYGKTRSSTDERG